MNKQNTEPEVEQLVEPEFQGMYGRYKITLKDQLEVQRYRISVLILGFSFCVGLGQRVIVGPDYSWIWLVLMCISLGVALQWIHIYIRLLHQALKAFWAIGCLGIIFLLFNLGPQEMLPTIASVSYSHLTLPTICSV